MKRRRGYVLVVTLGLLVLSATLLASISRAAMEHTLQARRAQDDLQRRWSLVSARIAILSDADDTLRRLEQVLHRPLPVYRTAIHVGGQSFELILSDEQAKTNVNAMIASSDKSTAETRLRNALSGSGLTNTVFLRPRAFKPNSNDHLPSFIDGFGQVFNGVEPQRLVQEGELLPVGLLTCWGDGSLNIMRASRESVALTAGPSLTELAIGRLIKVRDAAFAPVEQARVDLAPRMNEPKAVPRSADALTGLLARARIDPAVRAKVPFTTRSSCHSLWVIYRDAGGKRYALFVADETTAGQRQIRAFAW
jgi:hypothetical protein